MSSHRLHPITGPWPFGIREDRVHELAPGERIPLADRVPTEDSLVYADPEDAILYDGCARCEQHAETLVELDPSKLSALWSRMVEVETDPTDLAHYRTEAEGVACRQLYRMALLIDRNPRLAVDPWRVT